METMRSELIEGKTMEQHMMNYDNESQHFHQQISESDAQTVHPSQVLSQCKLKHTYADIADMFI